MAKSSKLDILTSELENRLDEIFREEPSPGAAQHSRGAGSHPLAELKKVVLSIDWEITADAVDSFLAQIRLLKEVYQNDKIATMFLQILGSLGQYIKSNRSKAHPTTFSLLNSVFARLEEVTSHAPMPESTKRKLLQTEMAAYQQLREKISRRRASEAAPPAAPAPTVVTPAMLVQAVAELKEFIRAEMAALRRQMKTGTQR